MSTKEPVQPSANVHEDHVESNINANAQVQQPAPPKRLCCGVDIDDENYQQFATEKEWEYILAIREHGTQVAACDAVGITKTTGRDRLKALQRRAARKHYSPGVIITRDPLPEGLTTRGVSTKVDTYGNTMEEWQKSKAEGGDREDYAYVPDPRIIKRTATHVDNEGKVIGQWFTEEADARKKLEIQNAIMEGFTDKIVRHDAIRMPTETTKSLLAGYPVGDHHMGMLAWGEETGQDSYDLKIGERLIQNVSDFLVDAAPPAETALVVFLGDYLHYDSWESVTPTSGNQLDADSRFPKMVRAAIRSMRYVITAALRKHAFVHVIVEIGNHDLASSVWIMESMAIAFENEPRVFIDTSPSHFHYYRFGKNLIGSHHGHGVAIQKVDQLPLIMATDRKEDWGQTDHHFWWTGHIHTKKAFDAQGCSVESFRVLAPIDAWAAQKGYRSLRDMNQITFHETNGQRGRNIASPAMFDLSDLL